jgi:hypothetical protein
MNIEQPKGTCMSGARRLTTRLLSTEFEATREPVLAGSRQ